MTREEDDWSREKTPRSNIKTSFKKNWRNLRMSVMQVTTLSCLLEKPINILFSIFAVADDFSTKEGEHWGYCFGDFCNCVIDKGCQELPKFVGGNWTCDQLMNNNHMYLPRVYK